MAWIFLTIITFIVGLVLLLWASDTFSDFAPVAAFIGVILIIISIGFIVQSIGYISYNANPVAKTARVVNERASYVKLLEKYEKLEEQDITASDSYISLYEKVCDFNEEVMKAEKYDGKTFWAYMFYDPAYSTVDVIPID